MQSTTQNLEIFHTESEHKGNLKTIPPEKRDIATKQIHLLGQLDDEAINKIDVAAAKAAEAKETSGTEGLAQPVNEAKLFGVNGLHILIDTHIVPNI